MDKTQAARIIHHVVETTKWRWRQYDKRWEDIDGIFMQRGYEQGGFEIWKFRPLLEKRGCFRIDALGGILRQGDPSKYDRHYAGSRESPFYVTLRDGERGQSGRSLYDAITDFQQPGAGRQGSRFWLLIWRLLLSCRYLKMNHNASFRCYILSTFSNFVGTKSIGDEEFLATDPEVWESFLEIVEPWNGLAGIGPNKFDFIFGDIVEAKFAANSYTLDSANERFLRVTGIADVIGSLERQDVIAFMRGRATGHTLREISKGIYTYCSKTEARNFGYCRSRADCERCGVKAICDKRIG